MSAGNGDALTFRGEWDSDIEAGLQGVRKEVTATQAALAPLSSSTDEYAKNIRSQQAAIDSNSDALRAAKIAARDKADADEDAKIAAKGHRTELEKLNESLLDSRIKLEAQKKALQDPAFVQELVQQKALREEINKMTADVTGETAAKEAAAAAAAEHAAAMAAEAAAAKAAAKAQLEEYEATHLNTKSKRELIVEMRRLMTGDITGSASTAMVLGETKDGISGSLQKAMTIMGGPYVVAAGLATVATVGVAAALWKASEAEAEMVHKTNLLGQTLGVSGEAIRGFQYLAVGTGVTTEELGRVFGIFEKNLGKNAEKFRELGISAKDPLQAFEQVMDKAKGMSDALERSAFLNETLGRGWEKVSPVIMQGGEAAREAAEKMKIPDNVLEAFERANAAQIKIDQQWLLIKTHSGEGLAGIRANVKETEVQILHLFNLVNSLPAPPKWLEMLSWKNRAADRFGEEDKNPTDYTKNWAVTSNMPTEEGMKAVEEAHKKVAKDSMASELEETREYFRKLVETAKAGHANYQQVEADELRAEADVRAKWAKKGIKHIKDESVYGTTKADSDFERSTGISYGAYSMAHPGGTEVDGPGRGASVTKGMAAEDEKEAKRKEALTKRIEAIDKQIRSQEESTAKAHIRLNEAVRKSDEEAAKARIDAYMKIGQAGAQTFDTLAGVMEKAEGKNSAGYKAMFDVAKAFGIAQAGVSMGIDIAKASEAGWPQNIALMAEAAAQGAIIISNIQSISMGHAKGGTQMGGYAMRHESGPEMAHAVVPTQIYQASHTHTTSVGGASITVHIHGGDQATILRTIRNATTNGGGTSH